MDFGRFLLVLICVAGACTGTWWLIPVGFVADLLWAFFFKPVPAENSHD